jgi:hypothetical protein
MESNYFPERGKEKKCRVFRKIRYNVTRSFMVIMVSAVAGCAGMQNASQTEQMTKPYFSVQAGLNKGGIVENTDLDLINGAGIDAFTGATDTGFSAGVRAAMPAGRNAVESGLDVMLNRQELLYNDSFNGYTGKRSIGTSQLMVPLTWNLMMFRGKHPGGLINLKIGGVVQFNHLNVNVDHGSELPGYTVNRVSGGATIGIMTFPWRLDSGARVGIYLDGYRGSRIYEDFYNRPEFEVPGSSYGRIGIIYEFGKF